jgi:hypothetical protein
MEDIVSPCQFVFEWLWKNMGMEGVETKENQIDVFKIGRICGLSLTKSRFLCLYLPKVDYL